MKFNLCLSSACGHSQQNDCEDLCVSTEPGREGVRGWGGGVGGETGDGMGEQVTAGGVDRFSQTVGSSDAEAPGPASTQTDGLMDKTWKR